MSILFWGAIINVAIFFYGIANQEINWLSIAFVASVIFFVPEEKSKEEV